MPAFVIRLFPVWALLFSALALWQPALFRPLQPAIIPLLMVIMFGMGMPLAAWLIGHGLQLETALIIGLVLVGASPGGTASNVICYLARGNVALSISLTLGSTLLAVCSRHC